MLTDLEKSLATVARGASIVFLGMVIGSLLGIVNQILLGRFLGVENYGLFNLAYSVVSIASCFALFGLLGGLPRFIPFHLKKGEKDIVRSSIRFSLIFVLCTSISIGIVLYLFSGVLAVNIFHEKDLELILKYFSIGFPIITLAVILESVIRGFKAVKYKLVIYSVGLPVVKLTIFIPLVFIGYCLFGAIVAYFSAMLFTIIASIIIIRKKLFLDYSKYDKVPVGRKLLTFSWPLALTGMTFIFVSHTDIFLLGYYLTPSDVGIYIPALVIAKFVTFIGASFGYIFLPVVSELFAKEKLGDLESLFKSASKWIFLLVLPIFLYVLLFPQEIITLLYGFEYSTGYIALIILAFGISMNVFTGMTGGILVGGGHTKLNLAVEVIAALTNVVLNIILIPRYGIIGAAIGTSASYFTRNIASLIFVYKTTKMHPYKMNYINIVISGALVLILIYLMKAQFYSFFTWWGNLILAGILLLVVYFILILFTRCLDKNDIFVLELITKKLGLKIRIFNRILSK